MSQKKEICNICVSRVKRNIRLLFGTGRFLRIVFPAGIFLSQFLPYRENFQKKNENSSKLFISSISNSCVLKVWVGASGVMLLRRSFESRKVILISSNFLTNFAHALSTCTRSMFALAVLISGRWGHMEESRRKI